MSLSNRFQHPFERWMNQMWRKAGEKEPGLHHRRSGGKSSRNLGRTSSRPSYGDWSSNSLMPSFMQSDWMEPYQDLWNQDFASDMPMSRPWLMNQTSVTTNDNGDHVVKARMPYGVDQDDIHLSFEDGGLKLSASKTHEDEKKQHGSWHKSYTSVSHYWPLSKDVKPEDIEAHFDSEEGVLEIVLPHGSSLRSRSKSMPISISGSKSHEMLDSDKSAKDIIGEKGRDYMQKAKDKASEYPERAKQKGWDMAEKAKETGADLAEKGGDYAREAKEKGSELYEKAKDKGSDYLEMGSDMVEKAKEKGSEVYEKAKDAVSSGVESIKETAGVASKDAKDTKDWAKDTAKDWAKDTAKDWAKDTKDTKDWKESRDWKASTEWKDKKASSEKQDKKKGSNDPLAAPQVPSIDEM